MASSGLTTVKVTSYDTLRFSWAVASQSIPNNNSVINWRLELISVTNGKIISSTAKAWSVKVNGTSYSGTTTVGIEDNQTKTLASGSTTIAHNADGTKSFSYSFSQAFNITFAGASIGTISGSGSGVLNSIPRTSTLTIPSISIGSEGTLTINRASSSFTHTITVKIGDYSTTIATKTTATSVKFTPPMNWCNAIPHAVSGLATYTITTYNGSTTVGSKSYTAPLTIPASVKPSIISVTHTEAVSEISSRFSNYIVGRSQLKFQITSSGSYGSAIKSASTSFNGSVFTGGSFTSDVIKSNLLKAVVTVTDSRGRTNTAEVDIEALDYSSPQITVLKVDRANSDGTLNDKGTALLINYGFTISRLDDENEKSYKLEVKKTTATTYTTVASGNVYELSTSAIVTSGITADDAYNVRLTITDSFHKDSNAITKVIDAPTAFTLIDYHRSGKGMAFGKVAEKENAIEIALPMYDRYGTVIRHGVGFYESQGSTDANTTIEEVFISTKNTPTTDFWYVHQTFYSTKSATANRMQYAIPYDKINKSHYRRNYVSGTWSDWIEIPVIVEEGTSGIWTYKKWSDGRAEVVGKILQYNISVNTALGGWYRSASIDGDNYPYPFTFATVDNVNMQFVTSNNNGGLIWITSSGSNNDPPYCYIIRPTSATGVSGAIHIKAEGTWN